MDSLFFYSLPDRAIPYKIVFFIGYWIWFRCIERDSLPRRKDGEMVWTFWWECARGKRARRSWPPEYIPLWQRLELYGQLCILMIMSLLRLSEKVTIMILDRFPYTIWLAKLAWVLCLLYAVHFLFSLDRLAALRPHAMRDTFLSLAIYPFFCALLPLGCLALGSYVTGRPPLFEHIDKEEFIGHLIFPCMVSIGWIWYFSRNKEIQK